MPKPISIVPYAKKSVLVCEPEDEERLEWLNKTLSKLGATKTRSIDRPGWVLSKEHEEEFKDMLLNYERGGKPRRARRQSAEPEEDHKIKHSRKHIPFKTKHFQAEDKDSKSQNENDKSKKSSKTSYIEWEDAREYEANHHDVESENERSGSEEDSSSDDELIQAVLARKMKCESSQKEIAEEEIKDSDEEDAVSYSRRLRYVYKVLGDYRKRITELEKLIQSTKQQVELSKEATETTKASSLSNI
jgi:hypothetical protein